MKKHSLTTKVRLFPNTPVPLAAAVLCCCALISILFAGCGDEPVVVTSEKPKTGTAPAYKRQPIDFYRGIAEPRSDSWEGMVRDAERLRSDGFNTAMISPPVLISQRAGGKPRVGLESAAGSAPGNIRDLHAAGLSVLLAPTTAMPGFNPEVEPSDTTLKNLSEDALRWAVTAEETQSELFSPLSQSNRVLGTDAAGKWSAQILPQVRAVFHGSLVAMVVPDLSSPPPAGAANDFEQLNYKGYDYLLIDIFPREKPFDQARFEAQANGIIKRASAVAQRDGLKGIMIQCGSWREATGVDSVDGPELGEEAQARLIGRVLELASPQIFPQVKGAFFQGWTLPGRGARDFKVEQAIRNDFTGKSKTVP